VTPSAVLANDYNSVGSTQTRFSAFPLNPQLAVCRLPAEIFEMRKSLITSSLSKPRKKTESILKTYELFIYEDVQ
jgi:hypothetical protein